MRFALVLLALGCLLSTVHGQWVEQTIVLPDSLTALHDIGPMLYNPGSNVLFVAGQEGFVLMDGLSHRVIGRTILANAHDGIGCYASQPNKVYWMMTNGLYSLDGTTGRLLASITSIAPRGICYNPTANRVYVAKDPSGMAVINAANDVVVKTVNPGQVGASLSCNVRDNRLYFTSNNTRVGVIECGPDSFRRFINVGVNFDSIVYNRVGDKLYSYGHEDSFAVVDCRAESVVGRPFLRAWPARVVCSPATNKVYCAGRRGLDVLCGFGDTLLVHVDGHWSAKSVLDSADNRLWCVTYAGADTLTAIDMAGDTICGDLAIGSAVSALAYNPARNKLYATHGYLSVVDPAAQREELRLPLGFTPGALCAATSLSKVYCTGLNEASVAVVSSAQNRTLGTIPVGQRPAALGYDRRLGLVCCSNSGDSTVSVIACAGNAVVATVTVGSSPDSLCVDTVLHRAWCSVDGGVAVVDLPGESLVGVVPLSEPGALLCDPARRRVYCASLSGGHVVVIDADADSIIASVQVGGDVSAVCLIPAPNLVCCATPSNNSVAVIDGATNRVVDMIPVGSYPKALLYNPRRGRLYCANAYDNNISVIACSTMTVVRTIAVGVVPATLAYDSLGDRIYCLSTEDEVVKVIDCRLDAVVKALTVGDQPVAMTHAKANRRMYVANYYGSSLTVIKDTVLVGVEETPNAESRTPNVEPTILRGVLYLRPSPYPLPVGEGKGVRGRSVLLDAAGRKVLDLSPGPTDVSHLAPGVYFVRERAGSGEQGAARTRKLVITR